MKVRITKNDKKAGLQSKELCINASKQWYVFWIGETSLQPVFSVFRFSADVKGLWKLGFHHVGAHARCGIVCKSMPFLSTHVQSRQIIHLSNGYFPKKLPKSHEEVPILSLGSISAALSCLVYPSWEETAGRVSSKPCLWRKFLIKILAVFLVATNVIW